MMHQRQGTTYGVISTFSHYYMIFLRSGSLRYGEVVQAPWNETASTMSMSPMQMHPLVREICRSTTRVNL